MSPPSEVDGSEVDERLGGTRKTGRIKESHSTGSLRRSLESKSRTSTPVSDMDCDGVEDEHDGEESETARFEIPDRDDDLLTGTSLSSFTVSKAGITLEAALNVVEGFDMAVDDGDYEAIYNYFDDLFNICRIETTVRKCKIWLRLADSLINAFNAFKPDLANTLCHAVSAGEELSEKLAEACADRIEVLQMIVYLIHRLTFHIEGAVIKRAYNELGITHNSDTNDDEFELEYGNDFESQLETWKELRIKILDMIGFICCINIPRCNGESVENAIKFLWRPAEASSQMLRTLASIIVKFAAHPRFARSSSSSELQKLFSHLRPICVDFKLGSEVARIIVKASLQFEYLNDGKTTEYPLIEPIKKLSVDGDMDQMMSHMLYFVGALRPRENSVQTISKPLALLIQKIAQCAPETFFENIHGILPFLEYDPPQMRSAILGAFCDVVCGPDMKPRYLRPGRDARIVRDAMTEKLQEHINDSNLHVRVQVLNCWIVIANNRRVPFDAIKKGLVFSIAERLYDKTVSTRRVALQFLVLYLLKNPFGKNLNFKALSETSNKLNVFKERVEQINPDLPGVSLVMERFQSFEPKMKRKLETILENGTYEKGSEGIEEEPFESIIALLVDMMETSMRDSLCVLVKLFHLGRFPNINPYASRTELVDALISEFKRYYVSIHISRIGDSFGELLQEMESVYEENMDLAEHALRVTQEKLLFAEQMTQLFPILIKSLKQSGFADASYAVTFCATCERFKIREAASALYDMYKMGNPSLSTEILNTVMLLFIKKDSKGEVDIVETANAVITRLTTEDMRDRHAVSELLYHMFCANKIPVGLVPHLIRIVNEASPSVCKYPALVVLALLTRVDPRGMREYLRDFQRCLRDSEVLAACEAVHAMSYLIPHDQGTFEEEDESFRYRLRAIDSLFPDLENFLFKVILSDDNTLDSKYWYVAVRHCVKTMLTLSCDVDFITSKILGKALWYAHRAAQLLVMFREKEFSPEINAEFIKARCQYWNVTWQRTTERVLMLIVVNIFSLWVVESLLVHVDSYFPRLLKRAMTLDEAAAEQLDEATEPYADYDKQHSSVEMDFAYREGLFARTISSMASLSKSKLENGDATTSESASEKSGKGDKNMENGDDEEDSSNRPTSDELIRTRTQALFETRLLHKSGVIGQCLALVVFFIRCRGIPDEIRNAALRAFPKFLLICPQITERASPTFFTYICCHPDPQMKEYLLAASVDVMHRFPSMLENHSLFLFEMPMDADPNVRITALLYLTYLLTHDVLKPRGTLSDTALCMLNRKRSDGNEDGCTNDEREVAALATALFREISRKGNLLVNVLPDLVCRICRWEEQVPLSAFKSLVQRLISMVEDKPLDVVVEKMCQRFEFCGSGEATEHNRNIAYYFSYFISQLSLSDSSFYKMRDSLPYFAPFMEDDTIYGDFVSPVYQLITSTSSVDVKRDAEEFLRKLEFLHVKSRLNEEERDRMSRALDKDGKPIMFTFADCDEPVEYDDG
ncbi:hypothetical protein Q1695_007103 [Nippostrongylus brasiliensis]|nr:hypothetical protein Q1695_007103 [Nippostrongylus brasiliensis]